MEEAAERVKTGQVTFAARDSDFDGSKISKNEILGIVSGKIAVTETDPVKAAVKVAFKLADKNTSYINIIYGDSITPDQAEEVRVLIAEKFAAQADINVIDGGQPIYHFIISAE
jgi:dihydroxyacetone kinase-like predicted kinase